MDGAGDRLEVVGVERVRIHHPVPADDVEGMARQGIAREPLAILDDNRRLLFEVDHRDLARSMKIALAVGSTQPQLAVGVEILGRDRDVAGRFDHEEIGLPSRARIRGDRSCSGE